MDEEARIKVTSADIKSFKSNVENPYVSNRKNNIPFIFLLKLSFLHSASLIQIKFPLLNLLDMLYMEKIQSKNSVLTMGWTNQLRYLRVKTVQLSYQLMLAQSGNSSTLHDLTA